MWSRKPDNENKVCLFKKLPVSYVPLCMVQRMEGRFSGLKPSTRLRRKWYWLWNCWFIVFECVYKKIKMCLMRLSYCGFEWLSMYSKSHASRIKCTAGGWVIITSVVSGSLRYHFLQRGHGWVDAHVKSVLKVIACIILLRGRAQNTWWLHNQNGQCYVVISNPSGKTLTIYIHVIW